MADEKAATPAAKKPDPEFDAQQRTEQQIGDQAFIASLKGQRNDALDAAAGLRAETESLKSRLAFLSQRLVKTEEALDKARAALEAATAPKPAVEAAPAAEPPAPKVV